MQGVYPRKSRLDSCHCLREGVAQPGNELKQRQVTITDAAPDEIMIALRIPLCTRSLAKVLRYTISNEIGGAPLSFGTLFLVIEAGRDRVVGVVRLVNDIGNRQL